MNKFKYKTGKVCFGKMCFEVEIARTILEKIKGLSGRKSLGEDKGMLFAFDFQSIYPFSMKNTLIPLDIIWLDKNMRIVDIRKVNKPCISFFCQPIIPRKLAKYVLEINCGLCDKLGIKIGDVSEIK